MTSLCHYVSILKLIMPLIARAFAIILLFAVEGNHRSNSIPQIFKILATTAGACSVKYAEVN